MKSKLFPILLLFFIFQWAITYAQINSGSTIKRILNSVTLRADSQAIEKVYLHTDKAFYAAGDTIWFKAYLFNAAYLSASSKSGILYVEIANDQNLVVKRMMVPLYFGLGWGNIPLGEKEFPQEGYYLRAYTSWMRNFDENYIFKKQLYISAPNQQDVLITSNFNVTREIEKQKAHITLKINRMDQQLLLLNDFQLKVTDGGKTWYRDKVETSLAGLVDFNFDIPEKADRNKLSITLQTITKNDDGPVYNIPLIFNRPENIDLQFMPEGGYMVAGIDAHVAFKALNEDGKGANVSGAIYDSKQQQVTSFQSAHLGVGSFNLQSQPGETYTAKIKLADGTYSKAYPLPAVKTSGLVLKITNKLESDSLEVTIVPAPGDQIDNSAYYLVGQSRGVACFGATFLMKGQPNTIKVSKTVFPTGVARFTLLNAARQPLNERIVYIDHGDDLHIGIASDKAYYGKRDSVALDLTVTDKAGNPVQGSFSIAVTDDAQVKSDSLKSSSLRSSLLLTSDIKGGIEDPGYYFPTVFTAAHWQQLDNLLLAQGWVNYDWTAVFQPMKPALDLPEAEFSVRGKVTNIFNKPVEKSQVVLLSRKPFFVRDTLTNKAGIFNFTHISPSDTAIYNIQARNKNGKSFNVGIDVDEFKPPVFALSNERIIPWYVNIDSTKIKQINTGIAYKNEREIKEVGHVLKEVKIVDKKIIKDSKNLNGDGESDFALNHEDLEKAGKATLGELLEKYVKGFGLRRNTYFIYDQVFHLIIDGVNIDFAFSGHSAYEHMMYVKQYLDYYTAEDIKGFELMKSGKYVTSYWSRFLKPLDIPWDHAWVEVTTRGGAGPFLKKTPGVYLYKPLPFASEKEFYSPKYISKEDNSFVDIRSTIYWAPNIITDSSGKAKVSFYTADKPSSYTLLIDGSDMNEDISSTRKKIIVK